MWILCKNIVIIANLVVVYNFLIKKVQKKTNDNIFISS